MTESDIIQKLRQLVQTDRGNTVSEEDAISPELAGMRIFDEPLVGFAAAEDELFTKEFKTPGVIHPEYRAPQEWLSGAQTVISFFLPFSEEVRRSNRLLYDEPYEEGIRQNASAAWLHARIEGQMFLNRIMFCLQDLLKEEGSAAMSPTTSGQLRFITPVISDWSERHAAYAAGLGTFGLSKGLITAKGMAGRFGSVITDAVFAPTPRAYSSPFEYCTLCGVCMKRCPAGAIDKARGYALGKDQTVCKSHLDKGKLPPHGPNHRERYGCGKCQVGVPCEDRIPGRTAI